MRPRRIAGLLAGALIVSLAAAPGASAAPTCAEGPETVGSTIVGTPCADTIRPPRSITTVFGEGGDDVIFGGRGNDRLYGNEGADRLYGGIGDDQLRGGNGDDRLSGGFGADSVLDGEAGNDFVRGDATIDDIQNTGGGIDTLSYATGVTPGFFNRQESPYFYPDFSVYDDFPQTVEGRGAYINLETGKGDNNLAPMGGGIDEEVDAASFEVVVGTAFPDFIVGTDDDQTFYGGGGTDVILGEGGDDIAYGGAEGDSCDASTAIGCESSDTEVTPRSPSAIAVGRMVPGGEENAALYLTGSDGDDEVTATYSSGTVTFTLGAGSEGAFDGSAGVAGGCDPPAGGSVACSIVGAPDSIVLAGLDGNDELTAAGFPATTSVVLLGNDGNDDLVGGATEDALVDGSGNDTAIAAGGDDALPNNDGTDDLDAGAGEDLFVSDSVCEGDSLDGGPERDNANWANFDLAVSIDMAAGTAGLLGDDGLPDCGAEPETTLTALEDTEGSGAGDVMIGNEESNQLLGRTGPDRYFAAGGDDSILANSGTPSDDPDPTIDCGAGFDTAQIDHPENGPDTAPIACESIEERDPNSFRPPDTPPDPNPPVVEQPLVIPPLPPARVRDRTPPGTKISHRPRRLTLTSKSHRRVAFSFGSDEPDVRFRCKLDRRPFQPCRSPRAYLTAPGAHTFAVFAIDAAGNRDSTPARFAFRVLRSR